MVDELVAGRPPLGDDRSAARYQVGDAALDRLFQSALASDPARRSDAAGLAQALGQAAPTLMVVPAKGATRLLEIAPLEIATPAAPAARWRPTPPAVPLCRRLRLPQALPPRRARRPHWRPGRSTPPDPTWPRR